MPDIERDISPPSHPGRSAPGFLRELKEAGRPIVLTINGEAEWIVQDPASCEILIELAERAEELQVTRRAVAEMRAGLGRPAAEMLGEMQRIIDESRAR